MKSLNFRPQKIDLHHNSPMRTTCHWKEAFSPVNFELSPSWRHNNPVNYLMQRASLARNKYWWGTKVSITLNRHSIKRFSWSILTFAVLNTSVLQSGRMLMDQGGKSYCLLLNVTLAADCALEFARKAAHAPVPEEKTWAWKITKHRERQQD